MGNGGISIPHEDLEPRRCGASRMRDSGKDSEGRGPVSTCVERPWVANTFARSEHSGHTVGAPRFRAGPSGAHHRAFRDEAASRASVAHCVGE